MFFSCADEKPLSKKKHDIRDKVQAGLLPLDLHKAPNSMPFGVGGQLSVWHALRCSAGDCGRPLASALHGLVF